MTDTHKTHVTEKSMADQLNELEARVAELEASENRRKRRKPKPPEPQPMDPEQEKKWSMEPNLDELYEVGLKRMKKEHEAEMLRQIKQRMGPTKEEMEELRAVAEELMAVFPVEKSPFQFGNHI